MEPNETQILLVEDDKDDIELALLAVKKLHLDTVVHVARDGVEALEFVARCEAQHFAGTGHLPTLVLLDLHLPRVSGAEVLKRIKDSHCTRHIPVVILTSSVDDSDVLDSYLNGANSYLQKPVVFSEFCAMFKTLCQYWLVMNRVPDAHGSMVPETPIR